MRTATTVYNDPVHASGKPTIIGQDVRITSYYFERSRQYFWKISGLLLPEHAHAMLRHLPWQTYMTFVTALGHCGGVLQV